MNDLSPRRQPPLLSPLTPSLLASLKDDFFRRGGKVTVCKPRTFTTQEARIEALAEKHGGKLSMNLRRKLDKQRKIEALLDPSVTTVEDWNRAVGTTKRSTVYSWINNSAPLREKAERLFGPKLWRETL